MFNRVPVLNKFFCCIRLRIGALFIGILETVGYSIEFLLLLNVEEHIDDFLDIVWMQAKRVSVVFGLFMALCLVFGAGLVSEIYIFFRKILNFISQNVI